MPTFRRCDDSVPAMARELMRRFETHAPLLDARVNIDFVFAFGDRDEVTGELTSGALKKNGVKALGIARKLPPKDRALGRADAEIALDGDDWQDSNEDERRALLDHELHHLVPTGKTDDMDRPMLKLRPHDFEFGWFKVIAARHGVASQERIQAKAVMDDAGQYFWPAMSQDLSGQTRIQKMELKGPR